MKCPICPGILKEKDSITHFHSSLRSDKDKEHVCDSCYNKFQLLPNQTLRIISQPHYNCKFCQRYCRHVSWSSASFWDHWKCENCRVVFRLRNDLVAIEFYLRHLEKFYLLTVFPNDNLLKIEEITEEEERDFSPIPIMELCLDPVPNITPDNVKQKLETYLLFS